LATSESSRYIPDLQANRVEPSSSSKPQENKRTRLHSTPRDQVQRVEKVFVEGARSTYLVHHVFVRVFRVFHRFLSGSEWKCRGWIGVKNVRTDSSRYVQGIGL